MDIVHCEGCVCGHRVDDVWMSCRCVGVADVARMLCLFLVDGMCMLCIMDIVLIFCKMNMTDVLSQTH